MDPGIRWSIGYGSHVECVYQLQLHPPSLVAVAWAGCGYIPAYRRCIGDTASRLYLGIWIWGEVRVYLFLILTPIPSSHSHPHPTLSCPSITLVILEISPTAMSNQLQLSITFDVLLSMGLCYHHQWVYLLQLGWFLVVY